MTTRSTPTSIIALLLTIAGAPSPASAQTTVAAVSRPFVRAYGEGIVAVKPDEARVQVGVVTEAATADEAATRNATQAQAVIDALRKLLSATADIRTISYSVQPNYTYQANQPPVLRGFTATNIIETRTGNLAQVGRVVDTAITAGANRIQGLSFGLKDDRQARADALRLAAQNARTKADVLAAGAGVRLGAILSIQEGYSVSPVVYAGDRATTTVAATPTTPVEPGNVDVRAAVTLDVAIQQQQQ